MSEPRAVFISYASQDAVAARRLCEALRGAGIAVWFDESELRSGDAWDQKIRREVKDCALFVPVVSANTASRHEGYFRLEWDLADQRTHMIGRSRAFLLPVCLDDTSAAEADVPESFLRVQWTSLPDGIASPSFVEHVKRLLASSEPAVRERERPAGGYLTAATSRSARLALLLIAVAAILGVGYLALAKWVLPKHAGMSLRGESAPSAIPEQSIGVLPFVNVSSDKEQEYFSDGLTEEMIDLLSRIPDLRVPARTSSFYFKGRNDTIANIARQLKVSHVLEGSVRKAGDIIRVSVRLVRADSGYQVWSNSYERKVSDIFKVQDEIAAAVVAAFKLRLNSAGAPLAERRTANPEAYDQYLRGNHLFQLGDYDDNLAARDAYRRAIELDPNFAPAYAGLANIEYLTVKDYSDTDQPDVIRQAMDHADHAVALAPTLAEAYSERALLRLNQYDWDGAQADLQRALALDPNDVKANRRMVLLLLSLGNVLTALPAQRRVVELDPLDMNSLEILGMVYYFAGQGAEARRTFDKVRIFSPNYDGLSGNAGFSYLADGQAEEARRECEPHSDDTARACLAAAEHALGHDKRSQEILADLIANHPLRACYFIAKAYAFSGNSELAFEWLNRAFTAKAKFLTDLKSEPAFRAWHGDPRYLALLRKMKLPD